MTTELPLPIQKLVRTLQNLEVCPLCKVSFKSMGCWQRDKLPHGELCLLPEGHEGPHNNIMGGYRWEKSQPSDGVTPCFAHADAFGGGERCTLPANHTGRHAIPRPRHKPGCVIGEVVVDVPDTTPHGPCGVCDGCRSSATFVEMFSRCRNYEEVK